jgi:ABC-type polysaccharide/polyol phosphate export permease
MEAQKAPTSALLGLPALMIACFSGSDLALNASIVAKFVRDLQNWWQTCM